DDPNCSQVMIAGDRLNVVLAEQPDAFIWPGAVAYEVTETPERIDGTHVFQDSLKGREVAMDVGDHANAQNRLPTAPRIIGAAYNSVRPLRFR
ncbi:MAG: hypothetical protein HW416_3104, partial [Chloroflexi bacterium]|nr:hypothetical protein [Chloroflexota bacterium]